MSTIKAQDIDIVLNSPGSPGGFRSLDANNENIKNVKDGSASGDAVNKNQLDSKIGVSDLKNNLTTTTAGSPLDAYQGKSLDDKHSLFVSNPQVNYVYLSNNSDNSITVVDSNTDEVVTEIATSSAPQTLFFRNDYAYLFVCCGSAVDIIDTSLNKVTKTLNFIAGNPTETTIRRAICSGVHNKCYICSTSGIFVFNSTTFEEITTIEIIGVNPDSRLALSPDESKLYATAPSNIINAFFEISTTDESVTNITIPTGNSSYDIMTSNNLNKLIVGLYQDTSTSVLFYDIATSSIAATISSSLPPQLFFSMNSDGTFAYAIDINNNKVELVDITNNTVSLLHTFSKNVESNYADHYKDIIYMGAGEPNDIQAIDGSNNSILSNPSSADFRATIIDSNIDGSKVYSINRNFKILDVTKVNNINDRKLIKSLSLNKNPWYLAVQKRPIVLTSYKIEDTLTSTDSSKVLSAAQGKILNDNKGDTNGPASSIDSSLAAFDGTSGKLLKDSSINSGLVLYGSGASINCYNLRLRNVSAPIDTADATTKSYVDSSSIFFIIAEINGVPAGGFEWSFGASAPQNANTGIPLYANCNLIGLSVNSNDSSGSFRVVVYSNGSSAGRYINKPNGVFSNSLNFQLSPTQLNSGDVINFYTDDVFSTSTSARICAIFKLR